MCLVVSHSLHPSSSFLSIPQVSSVALISQKLNERINPNPFQNEKYNPLGFLIFIQEVRNILHWFQMDAKSIFLSCEARKVFCKTNPLVQSK